MLHEATEARLGVSGNATHSVLLMLSKLPAGTSMRWDDFTGEPLGPDEVGRLEIEHIRQVEGGGQRVPAYEARNGGHHIMGVYWVDVRKPERTHRPYLMASDHKAYNAPSLFATALPIEMLINFLQQEARGRMQEIMQADIA